MFSDLLPDSSKAPRQSGFVSAFNEARFEKNISEWRNLSCGRLDLDGPSECQWEDGEAACSEVEWDGAGGISCRCNRSGSYALIWSREIVRVSGLDVHREYIGVQLVQRHEYQARKKG